jgi:hypothetical protein
MRRRRKTPVNSLCDVIFYVLVPRPPLTPVGNGQTCHPPFFSQMGSKNHLLSPHPRKTRLRESLTFVTLYYLTYSYK